MLFFFPETLEPVKFAAFVAEYVNYNISGINQTPIQTMFALYAALMTLTR